MAGTWGGQRLPVRSFCCRRAVRSRGFLRDFHVPASSSSRLRQQNDSRGNRQAPGLFQLPLLKTVPRTEVHRQSQPPFRNSGAGIPAKALAGTRRKLSFPPCKAHFLSAKENGGCTPVPPATGGTLRPLARGFNVPAAIRRHSPALWGGASSRAIRGGTSFPAPRGNSPVPAGGQQKARRPGRRRADLYSV
jgi:hypothetical protein